MSNKELCETLEVIARHHGDKPAISPAKLMATLQELEKINENLRKALYGEENDKT